MSIGHTFTIIFILLLLNSFFSLAEYSIASSRKTKLEHLYISGNLNAKRVLDLSANPNQFITVIQVGLNIIAILAGIFGDHSFAPVISAGMVSLGMSEQYASFIAITISVLAITSVFIVFSELIPKQLAFSNPEIIACSIIGVLLLILKIFKPFVWLLSTLSTFILKTLNVSTVRNEEMSLEEMSALISQGAKNGILEKNEHHLIENVLSLTDRTVLSAMTVKNEIIYLDIEDTQEQINDKILIHPHSRFLVADGALDNLLGYIDSAALLKNIITKQNAQLNREALNEQGLKPILTIPDSLTLLDLLDKFRESRQDISVVVNEFGMVVGLITLNDVLATLMGNVANSITDHELIVKRADNSWLIDGKAPVEDLKRLFMWDELPNQNFETVSGFLMYLMKCIPKKAQSIEFRGVRFEVVDVEGYRIDEVMATIIKPDEKSVL